MDAHTRTHCPTSMKKKINNNNKFLPVYAQNYYTKSSHRMLVFCFLYVFIPFISFQHFVLSKVILSLFQYMVSLCFGQMRKKYLRSGCEKKMYTSLYFICNVHTRTRTHTWPTHMCVRAQFSWYSFSITKSEHRTQHVHNQNRNSLNVGYVHFTVKPYWIEPLGGKKFSSSRKISNENRFCCCWRSWSTWSKKEKWNENSWGPLEGHGLSDSAFASHSFIHYFPFHTTIPLMISMKRFAWLHKMKIKTHIHTCLRPYRNCIARIPFSFEKNKYILCCCLIIYSHAIFSCK